MAVVVCFQTTSLRTCYSADFHECLSERLTFSLLPKQSSTFWAPLLIVLAIFVVVSRFPNTGFMMPAWTATLSGFEPLSTPRSPLCMHSLASASLASPPELRPVAPLALGAVQCHLVTYWERGVKKKKKEFSHEAAFISSELYFWRAILLLWLKTEMSS